MSKVVKFYKTGGPEVLQIESIDVPPPAENEVRINVKAIGLNRAEAMYRSGKYFNKPRLPSLIGYEASGTVESVGSKVKDFKVGDLVAIVPGPDIAKGVYGEIVNVDERYVVKNPKTLSCEEAAASWMQYLTAYGALIDIANITTGDFVIITAASSSVGIAAIQLCNAVGAIPIATTRKSDKKDALKKLGAFDVIATEEEDLQKRVKEITQDKGARVIFDPVAGKYVETLISVLTNEGILFQYGALSSEPTPFPLLQALSKGLTMRGYVVSEIIRDDARFKKAKNFILNALEAGVLKPVISKTFKLDQIVEAHQFLESNQQIGKIIVTV